MKTIERIKEIMNEKGIKQIELAKALDMGKTTINAWFNNNTDPKVEQLANIAKTLDVSIEYLVTGLERSTDFSQEEKRLVREYRKLNMQGQEMLWKQMELLNHVYPLIMEQEEPEEDSMIS